MRFVIAESFDDSEVNRFFEADIPFAIGEIIRSRSGKVYRVKDVAWEENSWADYLDVKVLLKRLR